MNVKKFLANTSREAWRLVREALGPDAVILSNRTVDGQVEILALPMEDMSSLAEPAAARTAMAERKGNVPQADALRADTQTAPEPQSQSQAQAMQSKAWPPLPAQPQVQPRQSVFAPKPVAEASAVSRGESAETMARRIWAAREAAEQDTPAKAEPFMENPAPVKAALETTAPENVASEMAAQDKPAAGLAEVMSELRTEVMGEIRSMRGMLEEQLAEIAWSGQQKREPAKTLVLREMLSAGFSASLARYLAENLHPSEKEESAMNWIKSVLGRNIAVMDNEGEILENGGVFALVGPTGVGKTTTTAKLAARCVMRHGPGKLALITTDGYRIGAYEQLRIYGKILGVMVHSVKDEADLRIALDELKNKHTILIDTVGMGQRDKMVAEQVAMLTGAGTEVKRLLCVSATSTGETLNEVVRAYTGDGLAGCIVTKLDEAATIGSVLDVVIRQKLRLYYVANGQRVPEDLHVANQHYLIDRAFKLKRDGGAFQLKDDELPLVAANAARGMNDRSLREVKLG